MKRIVLAYFDAGGGHRAAAGALADTIRQQARPWHTEVLNMDDVLDRSNLQIHWNARG